MTSCAISLDGSHVVSASVDKTLRVWNAATGAEQHCLQVRKRGGFFGKSVFIYKVDWVRAHVAGSDLGGLGKRAERYVRCVLSGDGSLVAASGYDDTLRVWKISNGAEIAAVCHLETFLVTSCAISPDGRYLVSASTDKTLRLWDIATGAERAVLSGHHAPIDDCAISPDGSFIVSASWDKTLKIWDPLTGRERASLVGHMARVGRCVISPDCSYIVSVGMDETLRLWDSATGAERATLVGHAGSIAGCAISPDASLVVSAGSDRTLRVWDAATGNPLVLLALPGALNCIAMHFWQGLVACGDEGGTVHLVELRGIPLKPIVVTAIDQGTGPLVLCPWCSESIALSRSQLGAEVTCLRAGCNGRMRVNPAVIMMRPGTLPPPRRRWRFWE